MKRQAVTLSFISENTNLKTYNFFRVLATARFSASITDLTQLEAIKQEKDLDKIPHIAIGQGSNVLFVGDYPGLVLLINLRGFSFKFCNDGSVLLTVASGEKWSDLVSFCISKGWAGVENLTGIPGSVGAAPIQNIGAYGVEISDIIENVEVFDMRAGLPIVMDKTKCQFSYRNSIFKNQTKQDMIITKVTLKLFPEGMPRVIFPEIREELSKNSGSELPSIASVSLAVQNIRSRKLPDPEIQPNAGSFFKNPIVSKEKYKQLKNKHSISGWPVSKNVKLSAAWLIEKVGMKGVSIGSAKVSWKHALVIVAEDGCKGEDILSIALAVKKSVFDKFGILLEPEVRIIEGGKIL